MILVGADQVFDEARAYLEGQTAAGDTHPKDVEKAIDLLNELLNHNVGNPVILYVLGSAQLEKNYFGLAIQILSQVVAREPKMAEAWNNLGLAYRGVGDWEKAAMCCERGAGLLNHPNLWANVAATYTNRGQPEKIIENADRALALDPDHLKGRWHRALGLLEMQRFGEAWEDHETRLFGGANENIANRNYHGVQNTPVWDGETKETVVIHGEQGMGDEIMFATCMRDAIATGADMIFEPSPRLEGLFKRSFPDIDVYGTDQTHGQRWLKDRGLPDSKIAIGSLPKFYRPTRESFPDGAYLVPDPDKAARWRTELGKLGERFRVGLAWQGGVPQTRIDTRSFHPRLFAPFFDLDAQFVSLQYDQTARANIADVMEEFGVDIAHFPEAVEAKDPKTGKPSDLDELAALIANLDLVITVPQTCYHVAGALGVPTWVMTPSEPDWRLGVEGETNPWYGSVRLFRQEPGTREWEPVLKRIRDELGAFVTPVKVAAE